MQSSASAGVRSVANLGVAIVLLVQGPCAGIAPAAVLLGHLGDVSLGEMHPPAWWWPGDVSLLSRVSDPCSSSEALVRRCELPPLMVLSLGLTW